MSSMVHESVHESRVTQSRFPSAIGAMAPDRSNIGILVVDDDPHILEMLELLLKDEGYRVHAASNADAALGAAQRFDVQVIISDIMMPGMSGPDLCRAIRSVSARPSPRVILMSAITPRHYERTATFIRKPFDIDHLLETIERAVAAEVELSV